MSLINLERQSSGVAQLAFSGSLTVEAGSAGPHFTLVVLNNPATNPYDGFAEVTDADNVSTLANGDEVTISGALGAHAVSYKATSSGGRPDLTIALTISIQDTVAPVLTLPTGTQTGATTATLGVTTNEGSSPDSANGALYVVVSTNATPPSAAQVLLGKDSTGALGAFENHAAPLAVSTTGAKTFSATGLVVSTTYYAYFVQKDAALNVSNVAASSGFTTVNSSTTWNPSDKAAGITLSNGNLTALNSSGGGQNGVRSVTGHSTGKYHVEFTINAIGAGVVQVGFASASWSLATYLGLNTDSAALGSGHFYYFNGTTNTGSVAFNFHVSDVIAAEIDFGAKIVRFQNFTQSSGWTSDIDISTLTNTPWFIAFQADNGDGGRATLNSGGSAYSVTPTAEFGNW